MIRFLLRFIGFWLLAGAFVALVYDGTKTIAGTAVHVTKLGQTWTDLHTQSLQQLQAGIERRVSVSIWQNWLQPTLEQPTWLVLGIAGAVLMLLGRRRRKAPVGFSR